MLIYYIAIALTILSNVFYHIFQKATPSNANPFLSLMITYLTAAAVCLMILPFYPGEASLLEAFKKISWVSVALGVAIVGLEFGFLLAYRVGWNISLAGVFSNIAVGLLIIPIGILFYHEKISGVNIAGIALCLGGLALVNYK